jgi:hypothetical protein
MVDGAALRVTITRLTRLIRQRRAVFYGLRGLVWGLCLAVVPVALRTVLGQWALPAAGGLAGGGALIGVLYGLLLRVPPVDALGLADRAFDLKDRLATANELLGRPDRGTLAEAAIEDAEGHARQIRPERAVPWRWPREVRVLPAPVLVLAALPYLPPVPIPDISMPTFTPATEEEKKPEAVGPAQAIERPAPKKVERVERVEMQDRDYQTRPNPENREHAKGDLAAAFKDTNVATKRPDFSSFLKQGDDRIRLLERVDSLPDLQRDFTQSEYKVMFRKSRNLLSGIDPRQLTPEKLKQLLEEMQRMGRRPGSGSGGEGDWGQEMMEGAEALDRGQMGKALEAMERALEKMRAMEERDKGGKGLQGGRDRGRDGQRGGSGRPGEDEPDFGEGMGSLPGKGTNPGWRGDPSTRLGQNPFDIGVEGQMRKGRRESYDTNLLGKGAQNPSRMPSMSVVTQYRKMMEEALAKESIPLDYRSQVRDYFQSLEER